jgi:hypothetical protein
MPDYCGGTKRFEPFRAEFPLMGWGPGMSCRRNNRKSYEFSLLTRHDPAIANTGRQRRGLPSKEIVPGQ